MKLIVPCKGCERREAGCHANCEEYQTFRKLKDEQNAYFKKRAMFEQVQNDIEKSRKKRMATGRFTRRTK